MSPSTKDKAKVWEVYSSKPSSKSELKNVFLGTNPTESYKKVTNKLTKDLNRSAAKGEVLPKTKSKKSPKRNSLSPKRKSKSSSPKRSSLSPKRKSKSSSPKRGSLSPKRKSKSSSPKRK